MSVNFFLSKLSPLFAGQIQGYFSEECLQNFQQVLGAMLSEAILLKLKT